MDGMYYEAESETEGADESSPASSALLPKSLLAGKSVGDTITLKVVRVWDDEIEVAAAEEAVEEPKAMTANEEIDRMAMG